jgi:hypothetical protein
MIVARDYTGTLVVLASDKGLSSPMMWYPDAGWSINVPKLDRINEWFDLIEDPDFCSMMVEKARIALSEIKTNQVVQIGCPRKTV